MKQSLKKEPLTELTGPLFPGGENRREELRHRKRRAAHTIYPYALVVMDILIIVVLFSILSVLRHGGDLLAVISHRTLFAVTGASLVGTYLVGGYNYATPKHHVRFISEHIIVSAGVFVGVFFLIYSFVAYGKQMNSARSVIAFTLIGFTATSIVYRYILGRIQARFELRNGICTIGVSSETIDLYHRIKKSGRALKVLPFSINEEEVGKHLVEGDPDSPIIQSMSSLNLNSSMDGHYIEYYVLTVASNELPPILKQRLIIALFSRNKVYSYESFITDYLQLVPPSLLSFDWALQPGFTLHRSASYARSKLFTDRVLALIGIFMLSPLLILTALAVRISSKGPIIFKQLRTGMREEPFEIYKFRSMRVGSEHGSKYTVYNDERLTPIGKFIRKTRLDELPQLFNVVKGDLSLVGPRAEWVDLVVGYEQRFPCYHFRHSVRPGITGWAQVNYPYGQNDKDTLEKLGYDLYYVKNCSTMLDIRILVKTVYTVLFGHGQ